jgi:DNA-directed RNA polymerase subunit M/transcription elongation factor TFIIS
MSGMIQFDCHYCLNSVSARKSECGREIACPHCQTPLMVPSQPMDANLLDDIFDSLQPVRESQQTGADAPLSDQPFLQHASEFEQEKVTKLLEEAQALIGAPREESLPRGSDENKDRDEWLVDLSSLQKDPARPSGGEPLALRIEGLDFGESGKSITVLCKVCDSRVHAAADLSGGVIECPVCFSQIRVDESTILRSKASRRSNTRETILSFDESAQSKDNPDRESGSEEENRELALSAQDLFADSAPGAAVSPRKDPNPTTAKHETRGSGSFASTTSGPNSHTTSKEGSPDTSAGATSMEEGSAPPKKMTRRERYEAARRRLEERDNPARRPISSKPKVTAPHPSPVSSPVSHPIGNSGEPVSEEEVEITQLAASHDVSWERLKVMWVSPGLVWRVLLAGLVIGIGSALMHWLGQAVDETDPSIGAQIANGLIWFGVGVLPYLLGSALLWLFCGFVFREAAQGADQVSTWSVRSLPEFGSTFLLFSFAFFFAGLPLLPIPHFFFLILPFRFMVSPLLLCSAWYSQNPFGIVAVDAFRNFLKQRHEWGNFYRLVIGLALLAFVGSGMMMIASPGIGIATSILGAILVAFATISFAALTGWHCGKVVGHFRD